MISSLSYMLAAMVILHEALGNEEISIQTSHHLPSCRPTEGQIVPGALSLRYTRSLLARVEVCLVFNRRFITENLPVELSALTTNPSVQVPTAAELQRLTEEQAFLKIYQLLLTYTSLAHFVYNQTSSRLQEEQLYCPEARPNRSTALFNTQRNADQIQELRCDVRLSSSAHGTLSQFQAAEQGSELLILYGYSDCSKRLLMDYGVAIGIDQLLENIRTYLTFLVHNKSLF
ncbi:uncharacterized protein LOC135397298 [Ornithodoros turicata]|uniref:uncharacterized protein LOC135397298 n=1 Tax=Ornithodoros turicata TaxID=34597 RepID=UPI00313A4256